MCGILGEYGPKVSSSSNFNKILSLSLARGPDMRGHYSNEMLQFGFNRLSIQDTSEAANQPIFSPSGRYIVICNGEIINFKRLSTAMGLKKKALRSGSDVEVLAHALDMWGLGKTLNKIRGMYAIAIFDNKHKNLSLVRDPAGIKPIYCAKTSKGWVFASQYDQIFKHPWFRNKRKINPESLAEYLQLGYIPSPNALFLDSWMIGPGEIYTISNSFSISKKVYYRIEDRRDMLETSTDTLKKLNEILSSVIADYTISDVPLGTFLSGGIDSPLVTSIASQFAPNIKAFTVSSTHSGIDESIQARKIAKHLRINHSVQSFESNNVSDWLSKHFRAFSEPFSDYSSLPTYSLCNLSSKHCNVMLAGDGGDELFWGYSRFLHTIDYKQWFRYPKVLRRMYATLLRRSLGMRISSGVDNNTIGDWTFQKQARHYSHIVKQIMPDARFSETTKSLFKSPKPSSSISILLKWLRKNEFYGHMQRRLLKVDRSSMINSQEVRLPLLDRKIIDFSNHIKPELGDTHRELKYLLKETLKNYVPRDMPLKEKQGFSINIDELLKTDIKHEVQDSLFSQNTFFDHYIDSKVIKSRVSEFYSEKSSNPWGVWTLYSLYKFSQIHLK